MKKSIVCAAMFAGVVVAPSGNAGLNPAIPSQFSITLRGEVPVVCRTDFVSSPVAFDTGYQSLGLVNEFCNSSRGYRVIVEVGDVTDNAGTLYYGGQAYPVETGEIVITDVDGPGRLNNFLGYKAGDSVVAQMSLRIEPKIL